MKKGNRLYGTGPGDRALDIVVHVFLGAFTFLCVYPFYYIFINTISNNKLSEQGKVLWFPKGIHISNYIQALQIPSLGQAAFVSVARTVIVTVLVVVITGFLGYMFTRETMWKRKFWFRFVMVTMYFNAGIIPWYLTMMNLGLTNSFFGYVFPALVSPFYILLVKTYVESLPKSLQEAAEVDGAGILTIFTQIMFPVMRPILATIAIFCAVNQWNSFQDTLLLMTNEKLFTLQFILYRYITASGSLRQMVGASSAAAAAAVANTQTQTSVRMTVTIIVALPILLIYPFFQRYFVKGIMIGAVKG